MYYVVNQNALTHSGIKGMKWGVRRYQNKDGSLTPAGKKRYSDNSDVKSMSTEELRKKVNRMNQEQRYINLTKPSAGVVSRTSDGVDKATKTAGESVKAYKAVNGDKDPKGKLAGQVVDTAGRTSRMVKKIDTMASDRKHEKSARAKLETMSDSDLSREVERLDLEQQYSRLQKSSVDRGKIKARDVLDVAGDVVAIGASAITIAVGIKKLREKAG